MSDLVAIAYPDVDTARQVAANLAEARQAGILLTDPAAAWGNAAIPGFGIGRPVSEPLHVALARAAEEVAGRLGAQLELDIDEHVSVPPAWEEALPRILREAVANAVRHGRAQTVSVHLRDADGIWLRVTDDGNGFDVADVPDTSFGLIGMKERAESLGGDFKVSSEPGRGTTVEVLLP
jgi:signal transduction histidine kinase